MRKLFTSESVTEGHPDKVCDQISDSILDSIIAQDKNARVACEVCCTTGLVLVMGEISTECYIDIQKIAREKITQIGYTSSDLGFDGAICAIISAIDEQSPDIALGVDKSFEAKHGMANQFDIGAGDQGMVYGFACNETAELMPLPIMLAHKLSRELANLRKSGKCAYLRPDGKTQVTVEYEGNKPIRVDTVVLSTQHNPDVSHDTIEADMKAFITQTLPQQYLDADTKFHINPTGSFVVGGPHGDSGLTGRKIIVDTYGGYARHGGGAYSGKDPTKVDRSASYFSRYIAKHIVAAGMCDKIELQIAYAIGVANPVSVFVDTFGTNKTSEENIVAHINENYDMRPAAIIERLNLRNPIYAQTAAYGHFGRTDITLPWEALN